MVKALFALAFLALAGCAAVERNEIRQQALWLQKAGFRSEKSGRPPRATPERMTMIFREVLHQNGTVTYTFTDPVNGLIYMGGGREMAAFQEISTAAKARRSANLAQITPSRSRTTGPLVW